MAVVQLALTQEGRSERRRCLFDFPLLATVKNRREGCPFRVPQRSGRFCRSSAKYAVHSRKLLFRDSSAASTPLLRGSCHRAKGRSSERIWKREMRTSRRSSGFLRRCGGDCRGSLAAKRREFSSNRSTRSLAFRRRSPIFRRECDSPEKRRWLHELEPHVSAVLGPFADVHDLAWQLFRGFWVDQRHLLCPTQPRSQRHQAAVGVHRGRAPGFFEFFRPTHAPN
jgi:hypothetical protein